jgi:AcrR family transcriptional regulator
LTGRTYRSPLRAEQARLTQRRILDAAYALLIEQGWTATTMAAVAARAGVSGQTVYKTFGSKSALAKRVYDVTLVGDDEPVPFARRPEVVALQAETDPRRYLAGYAALGRGLIERLGPLMRVLLAGARAGDPDLRELVATLNAERLAGVGQVVRRLEELGPLRVDAGRARDAIWMLNSVEVWSLLVEQRGWTGDEYAQWVGRAMGDAVLPTPDDVLSATDENSR